MADNRLLNTIAAGFVTLNCDSDKKTIESMLEFLRLLAKWNKTYNLTAIAEVEKMIPLHLFDSLSVLPFLEGDRIVDVGTGAGLPGIPLALLCPRRQFVLLDANRKKTRFAQQAILELGLKNVGVVCRRAEEYQPVELFSTAVSRAFSSLIEIYSKTRHLLTPGGKIVAMKGKNPASEVASLPAMKKSIDALDVPRINADRHIACMWPNTENKLNNG